MAKKEITKKQHLILMILYTFRFVNSKQIQEFLGHKDHRRINSWLKELVEKGYIGRDFKPVFGTFTKPAIYFLTVLGRKVIKDSYDYYFPNYLKKISRDSKTSKAFRIKCQIIADWYLTTVHNNKNHVDQSNSGIDIIDKLKLILANDSESYKDNIPLNKLQFFTSAYYPTFPLLKNIKQDAYLRKKTTKGVDHGLLFVIDAYIPRFLLRYTLKRIFDTLDEESWEEEAIKSLQIFFLCPNNQIIIYVKKLLPQYMQNYYGSKPLLFHFSTRNQLYKKKEGSIDRIPWITMSSEDEFE